MAGRGRYDRSQVGVDARGAAGSAFDEYGRPIPAGALPDDDAYAGFEEEYPDAGPWEVTASRPRRRRGPHIGPLAITPTRVTLLVALIGSVGFMVYAVTVREASQIPMLASGAAVLGIVFAALGLSGAVGAVQAGRAGAGGRAFAMALGGGIAAVLAFGCIGAALILALVWRP